MKNETRKSTAWAIWDCTEKRHLYVFPNIYQVEICSPDFFRSDIYAGLVEIVPVMIYELNADLGGGDESR